MEYKDNRLHIECDPNKLKTWELMVLEKNQIEPAMLVLCRYVVNGNGPIDKDLPDKKPLRRLTEDEKNQLMDGQGFMWLEDLEVSLLQETMRTFIDGASEALEKKK